MEREGHIKQPPVGSYELVEKIRRENEERLADIAKSRRTYIPSTPIYGKSPVSQEDFEIILKEAVILHDKGVYGDAEASKKAFKLFKELYYQKPDNHLAEAYLGSATALLGRDEFNPVERMKQANKGLKVLDRAAAAEPGNIDIRSLRAHVCLKLPEIYFHRSTTAIEDFSYIASAYEKGNASISKDYYHWILFSLGSAYRESGREQDAQNTWSRLLEISDDPRFKEMTAEAMKKKI